MAGTSFFQRALTCAVLLSALTVLHCSGGTIKNECTKDTDCKVAGDICDPVDHVCKPKVCTPKTCGELGKECGGPYDDGCETGGVVNCPECPVPETCNRNTGMCQANCVPDCGARECSFDPVCGVKDCGTCQNLATCRVDTGMCETPCVPKTCAELGKECGGPYDDGCETGGVVNCPECLAPKTCNRGTGTCVEIADPCALPDGVTPNPQYGAEMNPTGDPIGGGPGYRDILTPAGADFVVSNRAELLAALAAAASSQVIYVAEDGEIDLTGDQGIEVPGGLTIASGRGRDDAPGGLIFTEQYGANVLPLFQATGENVRFTGLRLRGPDPEIGDHDYETDHSLARGLESRYPGLEVDNCEVWGWSHGAVYVDAGCTGARVHHNHIHHNRRTGLGYGVVLGYSEENKPIDVTIAANLFDYCRHHVASTGKAFSSYEARYNVVLEHANSSHFDRHGTVDPGSWVGGIGGDWTIVHHNTVRDTANVGVGIRGVPVLGCQVFRNWFYHPNEAAAIRLFEPETHPELYSVYENAYGQTPPPGTFLPQAHAVATPPFGRAPLSVAFDGTTSCSPGGEVLIQRWDFGDGTTARSPRADHAFAEPGRYNVTLRVSDALGIPADDTIPVTVWPAVGTYVLSLWVEDSYRGLLTGYYRKQVTIDGTVVWEDDVAGDQGWEHVVADVSSLVDARDQVTLALRVGAVRPVTSPTTELIELMVYWDDVTLFGGTILDGDFEQQGRGWAFRESDPRGGTDTPWKGWAQSGEVRSGLRAWSTVHPYDTPSVGGSVAAAEQTLAILPRSLRGRWTLDDRGGSFAFDASAWGNHGILAGGDPFSLWSEGIKGGALALDGTDDHLSCGRDTSLQSAAGTVELWLRRAESGRAMEVLDIFGDDLQNYLSVGLSETGAVRVAVLDSGTVQVDLVSTATIADSEFHHLAVVQAADGTGVHVFLDGAESVVTGTNGNHWTDAFTLAGFWIGGGHRSHFAGKIDDVLLYAVPLAAAEIARHHDEGFPRGEWHLDEGTGTRAADSSRHGNHGTLVNMDPATAWIAGVSGTALRFDGTDDCLDLGADPSLVPVAALSLELWIRFDALGTNEEVAGNGFYRLHHRGEWAGDRLYFLVRVTEAIALGDSAWDGWGGVRTATEFAPGVWHHVIGVKEGGRVAIFVDGRLEGAANCLAGYTVDPSGAGNLLLGESPFQGAIDEVILYPRALSEEEAARRYAESH